MPLSDEEAQKLLDEITPERHPLTIPEEGLTDRHGTHYKPEELRINKRGDIINSRGIIIKAVGRYGPRTVEEIKKSAISKKVRKDVSDIISEKTKDGELVINKIVDIIKEKDRKKKKDYRGKGVRDFDNDSKRLVIEAGKLLLEYMAGKPVERKLVKGQIDVFTWADALNNAVPIKNDSDIIDIETSEE